MSVTPVNIKKIIHPNDLDDALGVIMAASDAVKELMKMNFTSSKGSDKLLKINTLLHLLENDAAAKIRTMEPEKE